MAVKLSERGIFTWTEWADVLSREIAKGGHYYECWLAALEKLAESKGLMTHDEREERIADWDRAARATPHGEPIELSRAFADPERSRAASTTSLASSP